MKERRRKKKKSRVCVTRAIFFSEMQSNTSRFILDRNPTDTERERERDEKILLRCERKKVWLPLQSKNFFSERKEGKPTASHCFFYSSPTGKGGFPTAHTVQIDVSTYGKNDSTTNTPPPLFPPPSAYLDEVYFFDNSIKFFNDIYCFFFFKSFANKPTGEESAHTTPILLAL